MAAREAAALRAEIRHHDRAYYELDRPEISDRAYDALVEKLRRLERRHPEVVTPGTPTERVSGAPSPVFSPVRHAAPLLSLRSTRSAAEVRHFCAVTGEDDGGWMLEPKLDGLSLEVVYEHGKLARASTRGDGETGEDVTANARTVASIPARLRGAPDDFPRRLALRGEIVMRLADFHRLNRELGERGEEGFANPRNAAAGSVRQLDPAVTATRRLTFVAYEILGPSGIALRTDAEVLAALRRWGLRTPDDARVTRTVDGVLAYHARLEARREELPYEIDGIVVKASSLERRRRLGSTHHHPRWALAWKFEPRAGETRVDDIAVQVGRTGVLTPVALLRPVDVGGVTVARATLHNREELRRRDIRVGDIVRVHRAGDVIPEIAGRVSTRGRRGSAFRMPARCPACGTRTVDRGPFTVCPNRYGCPSQLRRALVHFASPEALDIPGIGDATAALLVERKLVGSLADVFELTASDLRTLPGFAARSAMKLAGAIRDRRAVALPRLLVALGIPGVGPAAATRLATAFGSLSGLEKASEDAIAEQIGRAWGRRIHRFLRERRTRALLRDLRRVGVRDLAMAAPRRGPLLGKTVVFTGALPTLTRTQARSLVEAAGGRVASSVSGATSYVVVGARGGSKLQEATRRSVPMLDEQRFLRLVRQSTGA